MATETKAVVVIPDIDHLPVSSNAANLGESQVMGACRVLWRCASDKGRNRSNY